jgi:cytochrome c553
MKFLISTFTASIIFASSTFVCADEIQGNPQNGEQKISMCIGCHGIAGYQASFPQVYKVPKIAGQGAKYIASALNAYKKGDRRHPTMHGIAVSMTDQDIADVAAYYSLLGKDEGLKLSDDPSVAQPEVAALIQKGACTSCHGSNFNKPLDPSYPKIAGQNWDYLFVALKSYKLGIQPSWGRNNAVMSGVAKQFSNDELKMLAQYVGSQQGEIKTVAQSKFR